MPATIHLLIDPDTFFKYEDYTIESIIIVKNGGKMHVEYATFSDFLDTVGAEYADLLHPLKPNRIDSVAQAWFILGQHNGKGEAIIETELIKHLQKAMRQLVLKKKLKIYIKQGKGNKQNNAFEIQSYLPTTQFTVVKNNEVYTIETNFLLDGKLVSESDVTRNQFLLMHDKNLYILSYNECQLLDWVQRNVQGKRIKDYDLLNLKYLSHIEKTHKVNRKAVVETAEINSAPNFYVYIRESLGSYIIIEPKVQYDTVTIGDIHKNKEPNTSIIVDGMPYNIKRDIEAEQNFYKQIQSLHDNFKNQFNGHFQINFGEAGKKQWFYKFYKSLLESQIDIVGMDLMLHFRYSEHKANTTLQVLEITETKVHFDITTFFGKEHVPLNILQKTLRSQAHSFPLKDNSIAVLEENWMEQYAALIKHGVIDDETLWISKSFLMAQQLHVDGFELDYEVKELLPGQWKAQWMQWQDVNGNALVATKTNATLRPYQQKGIDWLYLMQAIGAGALLADDMGLGKTLQTIAYLQHYTATHPTAQHLIIAPPSLLYNWQLELEKFAPNLDLHIYYGPDRDWEETQNKKAHIIITTYAIAKKDIQYLSESYFDTIVLDESHNIKNSETQNTQAIMQLNGGFKIALSGTPVMNNTFDLYSQFAFVLPGLFYSKSFFKNEYAIPIDEQKDEEKLMQLQKVTAPFILRRTKEQVATDLPEKIESVLYCDMTEDQRRLYEQVKENNWGAIQKDVAENGLSKSRLNIINVMLRLRQICDSPLLLPEEMQDNAKGSTKLDIITDEIKNNTGSSKVIVFSQFTTMMDLIKEKFEAAGISYFAFDGSTSAAKRTEMISAFQSDEDNTKAFIISLKAGGVGITLTKASYVYIVDPWWNKAIENQAIDRCYRIGQKQTVFAYKMICKNSIEEKILNLQERKKHLSDSLITIEEDFVKQLNEDDLAFLFS